MLTQALGLIPSLTYDRTRFQVKANPRTEPKAWQRKSPKCRAKVLARQVEGPLSQNSGSLQLTPSQNFGSVVTSPSWDKELARHDKTNSIILKPLFHTPNGAVLDFEHECHGHGVVHRSKGKCVVIQQFHAVVTKEILVLARHLRLFSLGINRWKVFSCEFGSRAFVSESSKFVNERVE